MAEAAQTRIMGQPLIRKHKPAAPRRRASHGSNGSSLGLSASSIPELIREIQQGLPFKALETLSMESGIPVSEIASIMDIPERTLARRKATGHFVREESERLVRLSSIFEKAVELFGGDIPAAVTWLRTRRPALGNNSPLAFSSTELGAREVENLIGQLVHGVFP
jgi:putative toxin-antitoxin system antitoxin component (TIGR02293 family)